MKTNANLFTYFLSRSMFLGGGLSLMYLNSGKDTYISCILGILIGIAIIYIFTYLIKNNPQVINNIFFKIVYFAFLIFIIFILLIILSTFIYSYFLPFTPALFSCLPFIFLATFLNSRKKRNIYYLATIFFIISIITIFIKTSLLMNEFKYTNILPILSTNPKNIFQSSFIFACLSTAPFLLNVGEDVSFKHSVKYYLIASLTILLIILTITFVLGDLVTVFSYPEYAILRKIRFFKFIENIENFISVSWFLDIFITLSLAGHKLKEVINTQNNYVSFGITLLILFVINKYISSNFYASILIYKNYIYILLALIILLSLIIFITSPRKSNTTN